MGATDETKPWGRQPQKEQDLLVARELRAERIKLRLQHVIAVIVIALLVGKAVALAFPGLPLPKPWAHLADIPTLKLVGEALMYSAGFELAYMLFTPGPDEAVEPLIVGLAAAVLMLAADDPIDPWTILALGVVIGLLFYVRRRFVIQRGGDQIPSASPDPGKDELSPQQGN